jgi:hypothetical protein
VPSAFRGGDHLLGEEPTLLELHELTEDVDLVHRRVFAPLALSLVDPLLRSEALDDDTVLEDVRARR